MLYKLSENKGVQILSIKGRLDTQTVNEFEKKLMDLIREDHDKIAVDIAGLEYINSSGLRSFLKAAKEAKKLEKTLVLFEPHKQVYEVFEMTGFTQVIKIFETRQEALKSIG
ncbi:MAG: STAS domain-containing protein [Vulcanimicrobiota bacterium]